MRPIHYLRCIPTAVVISASNRSFERAAELHPRPDRSRACPVPDGAREVERRVDGDMGRAAIGSAATTVSI
jgi:hypothetical protein